LLTPLLRQIWPRMSNASFSGAFLSAILKIFCLVSHLAGWPAPTWTEVF
jgi:hypothetical protein